MLLGGGWGWLKYRVLGVGRRDVMVFFCFAVDCSVLLLLWNILACFPHDELLCRD